VAVALGTTGADRRRLWALAERVAAGVDGEAPATAFGDVGLFLQDPDGPARGGGYDLSPAGSVLVATAGLEGVHFSALPADATGAAPIVMTAPLVFDRPNLVLGADLREFLALGRATGYAVLEQLAHDLDGDWGRAAVVRRAQAGVVEGSARDAALLDALAREFDLRPWPDVAGRLAELERRYAGRVRPAHP
jgi:hypothetical protein